MKTIGADDISIDGIVFFIVFCYRYYCFLMSYWRLLLFFSSCCCVISSVAATAVAVSVVVDNVSNLCVPVAYDTADAKFVFGAADVVGIGNAVSVRGVTTVLCCCRYYTAAVVTV